MGDAKSEKIMYKSTTNSGRVIQFDPLVSHSDAFKKKRFNLKRKISNETLMLRYLHMEMGIEIEELSSLLEMPEKDTYNLYLGQTRTLSRDALERLCTRLRLMPEILLLYAQIWRDKKPTRNIPFGIPITGPDGALRDDFYWFRKDWLVEKFKSSDNFLLFKMQDNNMSPLKLNKGDLIIVDKSPESLFFRDKAIYMVKGPDGGLYIRQAIITQLSVGEGFQQSLITPNDPSETLVFDKLPTGISIIGRVVWRCGGI